MSTCHQNFGPFIPSRRFPCNQGWLFSKRPKEMYRYVFAGRSTRRSPPIPFDLACFRLPRLSAHDVSLRFDTFLRRSSSHSSPRCHRSHSRPFSEDVLPSSMFSIVLLLHDRCTLRFPFCIQRPITFAFDPKARFPRSLPPRVSGRSCDGSMTPPPPLSPLDSRSRRYYIYLVVATSLSSNRSLRERQGGVFPRFSAPSSSSGRSLP